MSHTITLNGDTRFIVHDNETILAAAIRQQLNLPHSCKNGICGQCKADCISGTMEMGKHSGKVLTEAEKAQGKVLLCCTTAQSDLSLQISGYNPYARPVRTLPARIERIDFHHDVAILRLTLPQALPFCGQPGQYIDLLLPGNLNRSYSIANIPECEGFLELHLRRREHGACTSMLFGPAPKLKAKSIVRIKGPLGSFALNENSDKPIILLATGTGYAPIRSILLQLIRNHRERAVHLYWGSRVQSGLYAQQEAASLLGRLKNGRFTPVLSRPDDQWQGACGYVQNLAAQDYPDLSRYEVYACGSPQMVESARHVLGTQCCLPQEAFYADAFLPATPSPL